MENKINCERYANRRRFVNRIDPNANLISIENDESLLDKTRIKKTIGYAAIATAMGASIFFASKYAWNKYSENNQETEEEMIFEIIEESEEIKIENESKTKHDNDNFIDWPTQTTIDYRIAFETEIEKKFEDISFEDFEKMPIGDRISAIYEYVNSAEQKQLYKDTYEDFYDYSTYFPEPGKIVINQGQEILNRYLYLNQAALLQDNPDNHRKIISAVSYMNGEIVSNDYKNNLANNNNEHSRDMIITTNFTALNFSPTTRANIKYGDSQIKLDINYICFSSREGLQYIMTVAPIEYYDQKTNSNQTTYVSLDVKRYSQFNEVDREICSR